NNKNENTQSINLSQHQMQASGLNIDEYSSSSSSITNSFVCDKKTSILLASGALSLPDSEQEKRILLANVGNWEAVMLSSLNEKVYHFLTSLENIQDVLVDQPIGQWMLPITTKSFLLLTTRTNNKMSNMSKFANIIDANIEPMEDMEFEELLQQVEEPAVTTSPSPAKIGDSIDEVIKSLEARFLEATNNVNQAVMNRADVTEVGRLMSEAEATNQQLQYFQNVKSARGQQPATNPTNAEN
ncbi:hypothetical protein CU098_001139, partial [Rhizopus stolonifer]